MLEESCWLFLAVALVGTLLGARGPLLSWPGVLVVLVGAMVLSRMVAASSLPRWLLGTAGAALASALIYLNVAVHQGGLGWPTTASQHPGLPSTAFLLVAMVGLWWRGARLAAESTFSEAFLRGFRWGLITLAAVALGELVLGLDLGVRLVAFPFFALSLAGLTLSHLEEGLHASLAPRWARVLGASVVGVLAVGAVGFLAAGGVLSKAAGMALHLLGVAAQWLVYLVAIPLIYLLNLVFTIVVQIARWLRGGAELTLPEVRSPSLQELGRSGAEGASAFPPVLLATIKWSLLGLAVAVVLYLLARVLWQRRMATLLAAGETRELVPAEGSLGEELASLLANLLPRRRSGAEAHGYRLPVGGDLLARVQRVYLAVLNVAARQGHPRPLWQTPSEYGLTLERLFPGVDQKRLTVSFNQARYGGVAPEREAVEALERMVEPLTGPLETSSVPAAQDGASSDAQ